MPAVRDKSLSHETAATILQQLDNSAATIVPTPFHQGGVPDASFSNEACSPGVRIIAFTRLNDGSDRAAPAFREAWARELLHCPAQDTSRQGQDGETGRAGPDTGFLPQETRGEARSIRHCYCSTAMRPSSRQPPWLPFSTPHTRGGAHTTRQACSLASVRTQLWKSRSASAMEQDAVKGKSRQAPAQAEPARSLPRRSRRATKRGRRRG